MAEKPEGPAFLRPCADVFPFTAADKPTQRLFLGN